MAVVIECIPNVSSADPAVVEKIVDAVREVPGAALLDVSSDQSHNRSVITFVGDHDAVLEASVALVKRAAALIDMHTHKGEHPRMGATDVLPFVPIKNVTLEECVALSKEAAKRIWAEAGVPVILYEASASAPHRVNLAAVRKGEFEGMPDKLMQPEWKPDYGQTRVHPTAGVMAVGARMPLVAFNINLSTPDITIANNIARIIRRSSGGLDAVKAIGVLLKERNVAQVSINMTDYQKTPLYRVVEFVRFEAARYGVTIIGTEIIGLTPARALIDSAAYYLGVEAFDADQQVLDYRVE